MRKCFLAALLAALMLLPLAGCGPIKPIESTEEEMAVIGQIAGHDVYYEELRYLTMNHKANMETAYGIKIWDNPETAEQYRDELEKLVWEGLISDYYAVYPMADTYYLGGSAAMFAESAINDAVQESVEATVDECGSKKKYISGLAEIYMTDHLFRFYLAAENVANELFYILFQDLGIIDDSDEAAQAYIDAGKLIRTNHVYLEGLTAENLALAEQIRTALLEASDKETELIYYKGRYCDDWTMTTTHGNYFPRFASDCGDIYEEAAFALDIGGVSEIITAETGYYVILRLPLETDYVKENFTDFKDDIMGSEFNALLFAEKEKLSVELNDYGRSIDIVAIK